jgi:hypothetical protein
MIVQWIKNELKIENLNTFYFIEQDIDGKQLNSITDDELENDIDISKV